MERLKQIARNVESTTLSLVLPQVALLGLAGTMFLEFSEKSRRSIKERANFSSELDPRFSSKIFLMQCAHKDHDRRSDYYNEPENGLLATVWQHHDGIVGDVRTKNPMFMKRPEGLVDHSMFSNPNLSIHFTKGAIAKFMDKYGSSIRLWKYLPPEWDYEGKAIGDELGVIYRPADYHEREDGILRVEIPLMLNKHDEPTERIRLITLKDILNGKAKTFSKII